MINTTTAASTMSSGIDEPEGSGFAGSAWVSVVSDSATFEEGDGVGGAAELGAGPAPEVTAKPYEPVMG